jgi:hypothetical protein
MLNSAAAIRMAGAAGAASFGTITSLIDVMTSVKLGFLVAIVAIPDAKKAPYRILIVGNKSRRARLHRQSRRSQSELVTAFRRGPQTGGDLRCSAVPGAAYRKTDPGQLGSVDGLFEGRAVAQTDRAFSLHFC